MDASHTASSHHHSHLQLSPDCPHHGFLFQPNSHHHHLELSPHCPLHSFLLQPNKHHHLLHHCPFQTSPFNFYPQIQSASTFPICPNFASPLPLPQNPTSVSSVNNLNSQISERDETFASGTPMMQGGEELEAEDDEEIIFVLTDEWKEFFAKSEAKRRIAKKQAKKKGKN